VAAGIREISGKTCLPSFRSSACGGSRPVVTTVTLTDPLPRVIEVGQLHHVAGRGVFKAGASGGLNRCPNQPVMVALVARPAVARRVDRVGALTTA
jgi:hypothetical protein